MRPLLIIGVTDRRRLATPTAHDSHTVTSQLPLADNCKVNIRSTMICQFRWPLISHMTYLQRNPIFLGPSFYSVKPT